MDIRVAIFEDRKLVRDAFEAIISGTHGLTCAGCFANAGDLDYNIAHSLPDVVLMDIEMPGMDGIEASRRIHSRFPDIKILIQTVFDDDDKVFAALCAGASGYILKNTTPAKLVESIIEVYNGGAPMSPNIASKVLSLFQKIAPQVTDISEDFQLSKREKENFIAYETVRTHVKKIYKKLHVASLTEAVLKAIRHRII